MKRILILGGGGMVGQKLARRLETQGLPGFGDFRVTLHDLGYAPNAVGDDKRVGDLSVLAEGAALAAERFDVIFYLASIVSGEAETNFDLGWQTNLTPLWAFLEGLRAQHRASGGDYVPRVVFTSSIAVFGGPYPDKIGDEFLTSPQTSYGAQKAACELMIQD
ncbi:MAG: NAD-dependent epimerase/dehydratase family protein, partial [Tateyamaria sp.]